MRYLIVCVGLGLAGAPAMVAGQIAPISTPTTASALEFQLPLPGESIPAEGGGLLVQVDSTIRQVLFRWTGPETGTAEGVIQFEGFFQGQTGPLKPGSWILEAQGFDATGQLVARRSLKFEVGASIATKHAEPTSSTQRVTQEFYVASNMGLKFGVAENDLQSYQSLKLTPGGKSLPGPTMEPYDQILSGNASMVYGLQQGIFRLKVRASTDASETWVHSPSPSRLGADMYWSDWAEAHLGDQYPAWSQLLMDGSRIRGAGFGLAYMREGNSVVRADLAIGSLRPAIDPQIRTWSSFVDTMPSQFGRSIQAFHFGVGDGTPLGWNLTFIHSQDKTADIDMALHDSLGGPSPRENLAIGTDIVSRLWKSRIKAYANAAVSLTTDDTRQGNLDELTRSTGSSGVPGFVNDLISLNNTTRGAELLAPGSAGPGNFVWENLAVRTGGRFLIPLGEFGRMRLDSRWIHVGSQFQSFARGVQETPRTGVEWSATSALAKDALLVAVSGSEVDAHPTMGSTIPTHTVNLNVAWTPVASPFSWHGESGRQNSGGGSEARTESWSAGGGLFGSVGLSDNGNVYWRTGYGYFENLSRISSITIGTDSTRAIDSQFTTKSYHTTIQTHTMDASLRWRPSRDLEWRSGYMLASQGIPNDTVKTEQSQTHRFQGGVSFWRLSHQLEFAMDGSFVLRPSETADNATGWDQTFRTAWDYDNSRTLRFSQRWARLAGGRNDLRLELGWEAWY